MKKLLLILLVLAGMTTTASADDYLKGSFDSWGSGEKFVYDGLGRATVTLAASTTYEFGFDNAGTWYTNGGTMTSANCIGWKFEKGSGNAHITTTIAGEYTFIVEWKDDGGTWYPYVNVVYPTAEQYVVHFKKPDGWTDVYSHRYFVTTSICEKTWPGTQISENANNPGYYDVTFSDSFNRIIFNDNGAAESAKIEINFSNYETWVTDKDNVTPSTTAPSGWVGYSRAVTSGNFGTICLPFAATVSGATVYEITGKVVDGGSNVTGINLSEVDGTLTAGKAYIFKATGTTLTATYSGSYTAALTDQNMQGNLSSTALAVPDDGNYFVVKGNKIRQVVTGGSGVTVGQYKGYIKMSSVSVAAAPGLNFMGLFDDVVTGIEDTRLNNSAETNNVVYNLAGQRVATPAKGLYIVNGKKVIIK